MIVVVVIATIDNCSLSGTSGESVRFCLVGERKEPFAIGCKRMHGGMVAMVLFVCVCICDEPNELSQERKREREKTRERDN